MSIQSSYKSCSDNMQIKKKGYQQTEIGVIPEDWKVKTVRDVGEVKMCKRIFSNQTSKTGDVPFFKIGTFGKTPDSFISNSLYNYYKKKYPYPKKGTVLISVSGTIGRIVIYKGEKSYFQDSNIVWIDNEESLVSNEYFQYIYPFIKFKIEGNTIQRLYNRILLSGQFPCPTLQEQKAIAQVLSDTDRCIESMQQLITKKKAIKQGAMQELLTGKKRLAGFDGEWETKKLGEVADITGAGIDKKVNENEVSVVLLNYMDVLKKDYLYRRFLNHQVTAPQTKLTQCNIQKGDIFITPSSELRTDIAISALAMEDMAGVVYSYHINRIRYKIKFIESYGLFMLKTREFLSQAETMCEGSGKRYVISLSKFKELKVSYPKDKQEQQAIAQILSDMDAEIETLTAQLQKTKALKQGLMQELLTGKTRLVKPYRQEDNEELRMVAEEKTNFK